MHLIYKLSFVVGRYVSCETQLRVPAGGFWNVSPVEKGGGRV